jgi:hypothetical protein
MAQLLQSGSNSTIPITTALKDSALAQIAIYRNYSTNPDYQYMLNQIEKDLGRFVGQTRGPIITFLQTNKLN